MKFEDFVVKYECNAKTNNFLHRHFTKMTESVDFLMKHRRYIEENNLGFGDRAFHYMWLLLLQYLFERTDAPQLLEIGVYKGQVISLWDLIAKELGRKCEVTGVTPLSGTTRPGNPIIHYWKYFTGKQFRGQLKSGNFYEDTNYFEIIGALFTLFNLNFNNVKLHKGLSSDAQILSELRDAKFDVIYIDGDHRRWAVETDIRNYAPKVKIGGFLVMDDASCNIPGGERNEYWKGHQSVSDACEKIPSAEFENVLNIGHNRIFQRKE